jgi:hypothetical protein
MVPWFSFVIVVVVAMVVADVLLQKEETDCKQ